MMKTSVNQSCCKQLSSQVGVSVGVCVHVHVCVLWGYVYVVINFRLPTWEYKGNIGMLEH